MFTVDELLSAHVSKPVSRWYKPFLRYLLCEKEFQRFGEKYPNLHGLDFIEQALRYPGRTHECLVFERYG